MRTRVWAWLGLAVAVAAPTVGCGDDDAPPPDAGGVDGGTVDAGPGCFTAGFLGEDAEGSPFPDGIGGTGDLEVRTDVLRAVFAAVDRPVGVAASGGTLIDLHFLDRSDHMNELSQLAGLSQGAQVVYTEMEVVEEDEALVVEVRGHARPQPVAEGEEAAITPAPGTDLAMVTRYGFRCGEPRVWIDSTLTNEGEETFETSGAFAVLDVMFWGTRSLLPFCPVEGQGDDCAPFEIDNPLAGLVLSPYLGATGSLLGDPGTFAFYLNDPGRFNFIGVHDDQVSAFGSVDLGQDSMAPGDTREGHRVLVVGDDADMASAADLALDALGETGLVNVATVTGSVATATAEPLPDDPYERPLVLLATPGEDDPLDPEAWTPTNLVRVNADGSFSARVPAGEVAWELRGRGRPPMRGMGGTVEEGNTLELGELTLASLPLLEVAVREGGGESPGPLPSRVVVVGVEDTASPQFGPGGGGTPAGNVLLTDGMGDVSVPIPPGTYDVYATHGPYHTLARERVTVAMDADARVEVELVPLDVIPEGFLTADFHVHSGASYDSSLPVNDRVRAFLAEGVDAVVATEHDVLFDYAPALAAVQETLPLSRQGRLRTFVGLESTATVPQEDFIHTTGHHNAFPLQVLPGAHRNGAPQDEYLELGTLFERLRATPSPVDSPLVQLNHGRAGRFGSVWLGYFDSCGFLPTEPLDEDGPCFAAMGPMGTRPWDFDAMEVINGPSDPDTFIDMSRDWLSLLRQSPGGRLPVGTANSDSHTLLATAGYPQTVLRTDVALDALDDAALVEAVQSGSVAGSLGVFVWVQASETGGDVQVEPGREPLAAPSGEVTLDVRIAAAPWIPVDELRVLVNGEVVLRRSAEDGDWSEPADPFGTEGVVRFEDTLTLSGLTEDAFVTLEAGFALPPVADLDGDGRVDTTDNDGDGDVDGDDLPGGIVLPAPPPLLDAIVPGALPAAFTNPIYLDVDANGAYAPPGTPLPQ